MAEQENERLSIPWLNGMALSSPEELIKLSEHKYYDQMETITDDIVKKLKDISILLVSGPSASTKTTTALKFSHFFKKEGVGSVVISLDNFFLDRNALPVLPDGSTDFESIHTVDLSTLDRCFTELLEKGESNFPIFDFTKGQRSKDVQHIEVTDHTLVIVEGIHALNPRITIGKDKNRFRRLYISPHSDYYMGDRLILSARQTRLIRRLLRDYYHRANPIDKTFEMWTNVVKSELVNIIPYQAQADYIFDSTILYEPHIYKNFLPEIVGENPSVTEEEKVNELLRALGHFSAIGYQYIPKDTVLREFLE